MHYHSDEIAKNIVKSRAMIKGGCVLRPMNMSKGRLCVKDEPVLLV